MEDLRKTLRFNGTENAETLLLSHDEFVTLLESGIVDYRLLKRFILVFYRLNIDRWKQIIAQILLLLFWGGIIFGSYLLYHKEWKFAVLSFVGGWTIKQWVNVFAMRAIKKGLINDKKYYSDLLENRIIGVYRK
ncbi:MAG: hypothetical protein L6Q78_05850 [Bacteroidia bacterium]|nr:hypothetical protein [Bacteroidia bacterium]